MLIKTYNLTIEKDVFRLLLVLDSIAEYARNVHLPEILESLEALTQHDNDAWALQNELKKG